MAQKMEQLERMLQEALFDVQDANTTASKHEADLQALSSAYAGLEAHAHELEQKAEAASHAAGPKPGKSVVQASLESLLV